MSGRIHLGLGHELYGDTHRDPFVRDEYVAPSILCCLR